MFVVKKVLSIVLFLGGIFSFSLIANWNVERIEKRDIEKNNIIVYNGGEMSYEK